MTPQEVQAQVAQWRATNRDNLVECPLSNTMSREACRKRRAILERIRGLDRGPEDGTWKTQAPCAGCDSLFEND